MSRLQSNDSALRTPTEMPGQAKLAAVQERVLASLQPVRPLPSDGKLTLLALLFFVVFVNAVTMLFGYTGYEHMNAMQRLWYIATILVLAVVFTRSVSEQVIPGQRARVGVIGPIAGSMVLLALLVSTLFPHFETTSFVARGIPCLRLGMACAAVCSLLVFPSCGAVFAVTASGGRNSSCIWRFDRRRVLALHCPLLNAAHIMVWHLGAIALSSVAGLLLVKLVQSLRN